MNLSRYDAKMKPMKIRLKHRKPIRVKDIYETYCEVSQSMPKLEPIRVCVKTLDKAIRDMWTLSARELQDKEIVHQSSITFEIGESVKGTIKAQSTRENRYDKAREIGKYLGIFCGGAAAVSFKQPEAVLWAAGLLYGLGLSRYSAYSARRPQRCQLMKICIKRINPYRIDEMKLMADRDKDFVRAVRQTTLYIEKERDQVLERIYKKIENALDHRRLRIA